MAATLKYNSWPGRGLVHGLLWCRIVARFMFEEAYMFHFVPNHRLKVSCESESRCLIVGYSSPSSMFTPSLGC